MTKPTFTGPRLLIGLIVIALALAGWFMLRKPALEVETALVHRGPMAVTVDDLGETRVSDLFTVYAPVTGELLRLPHKPGTAVAAGEVVALIQPIQPAPVDRRAYAETLDRIEALRAELAAARAGVQEAQVTEQLARTTLQRIEALQARGFVSRAQYDAARSERDRARAATRAAAQAADAALHALRAAETGLRTGSGAPPAGQVIEVRAPSAGVVLSQLRESGGPVAASTPLLELGDPARLEVVAEMLSADAVKVARGAAVEITAWGGDRPLPGKVRLVEPLGFRKISALGVEEQRVRVIIDLTGPRERWQRLGHGYRVGVKIARWSGANVLQVPIGALFRDGTGWAAFTVDSDSRARRIAVSVGQMNDESAQVLGGLREGQAVIVHPGEKVRDGVRVTAAD
jgi:HlyD family secretion protein